LASYSLSERTGSTNESRPGNVADCQNGPELFQWVGSGSNPAAPTNLRCSDASKKLTMTARIYKPAKTAMQSGTAKTKEWVLDFEPEQPREIEPLMGWTSSGDMRQQVQLRFDTLEEAVAYCERHGIGYQVFKSKPPARRGMSYADNFSANRRDPWTH
jgi:ETC complex I subunit conserved region